MFGNVPAAEIIEPACDVTDGLIAISHFQLDHPEPQEGWANFLGRHAIAFVVDDIGRDSIRRSDAQRLLYERTGYARWLSRRQLRLISSSAQVCVVAFRCLRFPKVRLTAMWCGRPEKDARPRRRSPLEDALAGEGMVYRPIRDGEGES